MQFKLKQPTYIPPGLALQQIGIDDLAQVPPQHLQTVLDNIRSGPQPSGTVLISYRGDGQVGTGFLQLRQGYQIPFSLDGLPPEALGEITLQDGSVATWIVGGWRGGNPQKGAGYYERGGLTRLFWSPDPADPYLGYNLVGIDSVSIEELVKVANSLAPLH